METGPSIWTSCSLWGKSVSEVGHHPPSDSGTRQSEHDQTNHLNMKTTIHLKSLLIGAGMGVVALLAIGAGESGSPPLGRYQGSSGGDVLLIVDTATGRAWALRPNGVSISGAPAGFFDKKADK